MALKYSTGLKNAMNQLLASATDLMTDTTISFGDGTGTGGRDQILDSGSGLAGFSVADNITVAGSSLNNVTAEMLAVTAAAIEVAAGTLATESAGAQVILAAARGGSLKDLLKYGVIAIYTGSQPSDADQAETGTLLCLVTESSGAFVGGTETNGLLLGTSAAGVLNKDSNQVWSGVNLASGTAGWFRFYANDYTTGASTTAVRLDGICATSGSQLVMSNTALVIDSTTTIDTVARTVSN